MTKHVGHLPFVPKTRNFELLALVNVATPHMWAPVILFSIHA